MPKDFALSPITDIIADAKAGKMVIMVDDESRENEGDLIIGASFVTPEVINFFLTYARGLLGLSLTQERCHTLNIRPMVPENHSLYQTPFAVSIGARKGITTGISTKDRAHTIGVTINPASTAEDIVSPGHVFPLIANEGGVLIRDGHTEASVDIMRLAGVTPAAMICEVMKMDGTMARVADLLEFGRTHDIKVGTIADLIMYRIKHDSLLQPLSVQEKVMDLLPGWKAFTYRHKLNGTLQRIMVKGNVEQHTDVPLYIHLDQPLEDSYNYFKAPKHSPLQLAIEHINLKGYGIILLIHEENTYHSPTSTHSFLLSDAHYLLAAQLLNHLSITSYMLLGITPPTVDLSKKFGINAEQFIALSSV